MPRRFTEPSENEGVSRVPEGNRTENSSTSESTEHTDKKRGSGRSGKDTSGRKSGSGSKSGSGESGKSGSGGGKSDGKTAGETESAEEKKARKKEKKREDPKEKLKAAVKAMQVAQAGMKAWSTVQALMMLKMFLEMLSAAAQVAISTVAGFFAGIANAAVAFGSAVMSFVGGLASGAVGFFGGLAAAAGAGIGVLAVVGGIALGILGFGGNEIRDGTPVDCNDDTSFMDAATATSGTELENAKKVYAFFKAYGLSDINIAGILGNWSSESHIDPTGVETIFSEPNMIPAPGMKKYEAWQGTYEHIVGYADGDEIWDEESPVMFKLAATEPYGRFGLINYKGDILSRQSFVNYHDSHPGIYYLGIGLGQWTNGRNVKLIEYADMYDGFEWYDLELQLMFAVDKDNGDYVYYVDKLAGWTDEATATEAAMYFCEQWEGITYQSIRGERAEEWLTMIASWTEGVDYDLSEAQSLVAAANASGAAAADRTGSRALGRCSGLTFSDNTSAAQAIVAYAWGPGEDYGNDGTACWQHIFESIIGDQYIRCCDRTVCAAIRWSGTDSDYPVGGTGVQFQYLLSSPRWQKVDWGGDKTKLLPGDVLIRNDGIVNVREEGEDAVHHTLMYVGNDIIKQKFGDEYNGISTAGYEVVSGSINQYSPHVGRFSTGRGSGNYPSYYAFRNIEKYNDRPDWTDLSCVS